MTGEELEAGHPSPAAEAGNKGAAGDGSFTVYVGNLSPQATELELGALFGGLAPLTPPINVKVMRDKVTGMSAGFGFVTFADRSAAEHALETLNGQLAWGRPLKLQWAQHRGAAAHAAPGAEGGQGFDVFVGDLARDIDEQKLREAFSHLGNVTRTVVMWDYPTGRNKGYGFVSFATQQEAEQAIQQMHGAMVGTRPVRCGWGQRRVPGGGGGGGGALQQQQQQQQQPFGGQWGGRGQQQQQQWGGGGCQRWGPGGPQGMQQQGFPKGAAGFPQLPAVMLGMQMGMDAQQAQQLAQLAQPGVAAFPAVSGARALGDGAPQQGLPVANGVPEPRGQGRGKGGKGGGGGAAPSQSKAPAGLPVAQAEVAAHPHPQGSSVSLPALAEGGRGGAGGSCCVRVDNLDKTVQKAELFSAFAKFGSVQDCNIVRKGNPYHAIVRMATPQQASEAAAGMNGFSLDGRRLRCAVEGASAGADGAGALPRPKSTSDLPMPPRAQDRSQALGALAAKMRAVLQDRGELPAASPPGTAGRGMAAQGAQAPSEGAGGFGGHGQRASPRGAAGQGAGAGFGGMGGRQQAQHAAHQWMSPGHMRGGSEPSPAGGRGGGAPQHAKHAPPPIWAQQPQHMLAPQLLMAQQQAQHAQQQQSHMRAAGGAAGAGGAPPQMLGQPGMPPPLAFGAGGVVLPPQLAMLNMMAQGVPGAPPPAFTLPMMWGGSGGPQAPPMAVAPPGMQPGFAALQQQALIQQLLMHQQAQAQQAAAEQQAGGGESGGAVAGTPESSTPQPESVPSAAATPPPATSTPPPQQPAEELSLPAAADA